MEQQTFTHKGLSSTELHARLQPLWSATLQLTLSAPAPDRTDGPEKITGRLVQLKGQVCLQFTQHLGQQQIHRNLPLDQALEQVTHWLQQDFRNLHLYSRLADVTAKRRSGGTFEFRQTPPSKTGDVAAHDRTKQYLIPDGTPCEFLHRIGVMNREGKVLAAKYDKFRQINRFLELVQDVLPELPQSGPLRVVDFGSGKSYLTFALHHLLTHIHQRQVHIVGVDRKTAVIRDCQQIAGELGCSGLAFHAGEIGQFGQVGAVDLMVSLHACDTATDAALAQAVQWQTPVILAVPCCQHELAAGAQFADELASVAAHGILAERFAALATDALRADLLEMQGYQTQIIEFIDLEHTPKNLLIRAVHKGVTPERVSRARTRYDALRRLVGFPAPALAVALGTETLTASASRDVDRSPSQAEGSIVP